MERSDTMSDFGYSLIVDPGGEDLLRCAESHDVEY